MEKTLIIVRGIPGSGKTTFAELLSDNGKYPICCADDWFNKTYGEYKWSTADMGKAHNYSKELARTSMESGIERVIVANTSTTLSEMNPYIKMAEENGYRVTSIIVENRHGNKSVHNVPDSTIEIMKNRFDIKL